MTRQTALDEIAAERRRQIEVEDWSAEHDDCHDGGEIALAAACYAASSTLESSTEVSGGPHRWPARKMLWPWDMKWWKPKGRRRDLVRAAALIVAEIERLDRADGELGDKA